MNGSRQTETRTCPNCGKAFVPKRKNSRYCCVKCYRKSYRTTHRRELCENSKRWSRRHPRRKTLQELECPQCGKVFTQTDSRQKYCCNHCATVASVSRRREKINEWDRIYYRRKHSVEREKRLCAFCGLEFVPKRKNSTCCSRRCSHAWFRSKHREQLARYTANYRRTPGGRALAGMYRVEYNERLEKDPEAYAAYRRRQREYSRRKHDRTRVRPYRPKLAHRFPVYAVKGQDMNDFYSPKFCEITREGKAFARDLAIENGKKTGRFQQWS